MAMTAAHKRFQKTWYASNHNGHRVHHAATDADVPLRTVEETRAILGLTERMHDEIPVVDKPVFAIPRTLWRYIHIAVLLVLLVFGSPAYAQTLVFRGNASCSDGETTFVCAVFENTEERGVVYLGVLDDERQVRLIIRLDRTNGTQTVIWTKPSVDGRRMP